MTCYRLSLNFTYICTKKPCHKGINAFPAASLSSLFFLNFFIVKADILLDSALTFKPKSGENEQVGNNLMEVRLVLKMTIQSWT